MAVPQIHLHTQSDRLDLIAIHCAYIVAQSLTLIAFLTEQAAYPQPKVSDYAGIAVVVDRVYSVDRGSTKSWKNSSDVGQMATNVGKLGKVVGNSRQKSVQLSPLTSCVLSVTG